jgi:hypothetical protein
MPSNSIDVIREGLQRARWTITDLWVAALSIGGDLSRRDIEQITGGERPATPIEHDILATALNDHFMDLGEAHPILCWAQLTQP